MNPIYTLFTPDSGELAERVEARRLFLGISDELAFQKLLLGFFESGLKRYRTEKSDLKAYSHLEFFAGSLTARLFRGLLTEFLTTQNALDTLDPESIRTIHLFLEASQKGADQTYLIDLIRSQDLRYILLTLTGSNLFLEIGGGFSVEKSDMDALIQLTLDRVSSLQLGETISFLTGTLTHEIQLAIYRDKYLDIWECYICDSNCRYACIYELSKEEILSTEFWQKIYTEKLGGETQFILDRFYNERHESIRTSVQKYKTCHFKCQLSLLKIFLIHRTALTLSANRACLDWHQFQVAFGNFLLGKMSQNDPGLREIGQISHQKEMRRLKEISFFFRGIQEGKYEKIKEAYLEIFKKLNVSIEYIRTLLCRKSELKSLLALHHQLISELNRYLHLTLDQVIALFNDIDSPYIHYTVERFKNKYIKKQRIAEQQLKDEIANFSSISHLFSEMHLSAISYINNLIEEYMPLKKDGMPKTRLDQFQPIASSLDSLKKYLLLFEENSEWLVNLHAKHSFADLLIQGIYTGHLKEVGSIFSKLNSKDAHWFAKNIAIHLLEQKTSLPETVIRYFLSHIDAFPDIRDSLVRQAAVQLYLPILFPLYDSAAQQKEILRVIHYRFLEALCAPFTRNELQDLEERISLLDSDHPVTSLLKRLLSQRHELVGPPIS